MSFLSPHSFVMFFFLFCLAQCILGLVSLWSTVAFKFGQNEEYTFFVRKGSCWSLEEWWRAQHRVEVTVSWLHLWEWCNILTCPFLCGKNSGSKLCLSWPYMKRQFHFWGPLLKSQIPHLLYLKVCPHLRCFLFVSPGLHWIYLQWYPALKRFHDPSQFFGLAWGSVWLIRGSALLSRNVLQRIEGTRLTFIHRIASSDSGSAAAFQSCTNEQRHAVGFEGSAWMGRRSCRSCLRQ